MSLIKILFLMFLAMLAGCGPSADLEVSRKFQEAQTLYNAASAQDDFLQAAALYQQIVDQGFLSGIVFYNLGNAYMQAEKKGLAIAAYRQAQRYDPRNPYLKPNLEAAFGGAESLEKPRTLIDHLLFWKDWLSYPEKVQLTLGSAGLCLLFALLGVILRSQKVWKRMKWVGLFLTLILFLSALYDWVRFDVTKHGVVIAEETTGRKGASENFDPAFTENLTETTEFKLLETRGDWFRIQLLNNDKPEGWILARDAQVY